MAAEVAGPMPPTDVFNTTLSKCANCGVSNPLTTEGLGQDAQKRIEELESQVRLLTQKATTAVDKLADYEDEIRRLKSGQPQRTSVNGLQTSSDTNLLSSAPNVGTPPEQSATPPLRPQVSRFSSLLSRRASPAPVQQATTSPSRPPSVREAELQEALQRELEARQQAETKVTQMSGELEELSAQLFQQANEMVASERKARARLEERVEVLEGRDAEKRKRLERLERAVGRIERVHGLLKG